MVQKGADVVLKLTDKREGYENNKFTLEEIDINTYVSKVSELVAEKLPDQPKWNEIMLYIGNRYLEDDQNLSFYNRSKRTVLYFDIYERRYLNITVVTLPVLNIAGCICVPIWAYCFRQKVTFPVGDYISVLALKQKIVETFADPKGRFNAENLSVIYKGRQLFFNDRDLKEEKLKDGDSLTVPVPMCFRLKKNPVVEDSEEENSPVTDENSPVADENSPNEEIDGEENAV